MVHASTSGAPVSPSVVAAMPPGIQAALGLGSQEPGAAADAVNTNKELPASASARSSSPSIIDLCGEDTETDESSPGRGSSRPSSRNSNSGTASVSSASSRSSCRPSSRNSNSGTASVSSASSGSRGRPSSRNSNSGTASVSSASSGSRGPPNHSAEIARLKEQQTRYETEGEEYGRGKRRVKPVAVRIGKDMVKIGNMYEVKGEQYIYDKIDVEASRPAPKPLPPKPKPKPQTKPKPTTGLAAEYAQLQAALKARNATVDAMKADARGRRAQFLRQHVEAIRPFVSPAVAARIESVPLAPAAAAAAARAGAVQQQPEVVTGGEMRDYQLLGLQFMLQRHEAGVPIILGDEMGLGKTLQSLAFLAHLHLERGIKAPSLVVCPLSVLTSWANEARRWVPDLKVFSFHTSNMDERRRQCKEVLPRADFHVVITTYEMLKNDVCRHTLVQTVHWSYLVLDEGHMLKSAETEISQIARKLHLGNTLLLTGTPLQNNLVELWALLNFLLPDVFDEASGEIFAGCFNINSFKEKRVDPAMLGKAHALLKPFMLRRLKVDVERGLPLRIETKVVCHLSEMQRFWYERLLLKDADIMDRLKPSSEEEGLSAEQQRKKKLTQDQNRRLQSLFVQLRKACAHPFLFWGAETSEETDLDEMINASGKLHTLDRLLARLQARGHRVVIFSQWTHTLDILDDYLFLRGYRYTRLDGGTNRVRRQINIEAFNAPESPLFAFLMTTRAGGLGVNLQTADTVILFDSDWNPQADAQAMARVHRIGQTKIVHVYRLMTKGTIEERIMEKAEKKLFLGEHVNRDSLVEARARAGSPSKALQQSASAASAAAAEAQEEDQGMDEDGLTNKDRRDLLSSLTFGADAVAMASANEPLDDATLDAIVDRTRTGNECLETLKADKKTAATFDAEKEETSTRVLQGVTYDVPKIEGLWDISKEWAAVAGEQRKRKNRVELLEVKGSGYGAAAVPVLRENNYDLEAGEASVFQRELAGRADQEDFKVVKRSRLTVGRDFAHDDFCQACCDGGELVCCDYCPSVWHEACLAGPPAKNQWRCPQHNCFECGRNPHAAGGVIFRCICCAFACCYDHKPASVAILAANARHEALGFPPMQHFCYVTCSAECQQYATTTLKLFPPPEDALYLMEG